MDLLEHVHTFGLTNIHNFGPNISLIRLFSLMLNYAKPQILSNKIHLNALSHPFFQKNDLTKKVKVLQNLWGIRKLEYILLNINV